MGLEKVTGSEISETQVLKGNSMLDACVLTTHSEEATARVLRESTYSVVSMIGALEHLQNPPRH